MCIKKTLSVILQVLLILSCGLCTQIWAEEVRFSKFDEQGKLLPADADNWAMVYDAKSKLNWEVKTKDGSIQDKDNTYSWKQAEEEYVVQLNKEKFGGYSDWRMPMEKEMFTIRNKKFTPYIDPDFFPNTAPAPYWSYDICGDGSFITKKTKFGKDRTKTKGKRVRAVRGEVVKE